jgi:hypothetical protein
MSLNGLELVEIYQVKYGVLGLRFSEASVGRALTREIGYRPK